MEWIFSYSKNPSQIEELVGPEAQEPAAVPVTAEALEAEVSAAAVDLIGSIVLIAAADQSDPVVLAIADQEGHNTPVLVVREEVRAAVLVFY